VAEAMSRHLPLHRIATTLLPGYQAFRVPARGVWICGMVICILAAFGLARWQTAPAPLKKRFLAIMAVVAILMSIALVVRFGVHPELALFAVLAAGGAAILGLMRDAHGMAIATVGFTILDLGGQALSLVPRAPSGTRTPAPWYLSQLGADPSAFRVLDAGSDWTGYAAASYGIRQLDGAGYPILSRTREFYAPAWEPPPEARMDTLGVGKVVVDPERLDALNVGWLVWVGPSPESGLVEVARHGDSVLYRRPTVRPYATAGTNAVEAGRRGNSILARVALDGPERLVVSESWMPGWRVEVDGRAGSVVAHRGVLLGVELSAGGHDVRFTYLPATFRPGLAISLTALLGTLGFLLRCWMRDRRQAGVSPAAIGI
ncbi:MAG TPA: YfhO family protein, partial [Planctomycetota bacterium]|nr:YfhO family protein [Planctomycetota bacterium]